jgi:uncharacterized protein (TIGR04222 family)
MNPLELRGPEFLLLYVGLAVAAIPAGYLLRRVAEGFGISDAVISSPLSAHDVAYLRGGVGAVAEATLAQLLRRGTIAVDDTGERLVLASPAGGRVSTTPLESEFLASLDAEASLPASVMRDRLEAIATRLAAHLERQGLAFSEAHQQSLGLVFCLPMLAVLALGIAKIGVGLSRGRPVGILVFFCIATAMAAVALSRQRSLVTAAGRAALRRARVQNEALRETASRRPANLSPDDVAMAAALFGLGAVADPSMLALHRQLQPPPRQVSGTSSGCGSGSSCGSSSGSSCGSGCGGGGGCGGCGG